MRYRKLDAAGDYSFGNQQGDFLLNTPQAVAQAVQTRLQLEQGEWFLDTSDGTPWSTQVLAERTAGTRDAAIQARVLGTTGVSGIDSYTSTFDVDSRRLTVSLTLDTDYGSITLSETL